MVIRPVFAVFELVGLENLLSAATSTTATATINKEQLAVSYAAIALVSFLGVVILTAVVAGARYVRRLNRRPLPPSQMASDRWYEKPLVDPAAGQPSDETSDVE